MTFFRLGWESILLGLFCRFVIATWRGHAESKQVRVLNLDLCHSFPIWNPIHHLWTDHDTPMYFHTGTHTYKHTNIQYTSIQTYIQYHTIMHTNMQTWLQTHIHTYVIQTYNHIVIQTYFCTYRHTFAARKGSTHDEIHRRRAGPDGHFAAAFALAASEIGVAVEHSQL